MVEDNILLRSSVNWRVPGVDKLTIIQMEEYPMSTRRPVRSNDEWMDLITESRQSGLPDSVWCEQHDIPQSSFYNAVSRLRKLACDIPAPADRAKTAMDFTAKQEVVQIDIISDQDDLPGRLATPVPAMQDKTEHLDNSHKIEIILGSTSSIRVCNGADPELLKAAIRSLRVTLC